MNVQPRVGDLVSCSPWAYVPMQEVPDEKRLAGDFTFGLCLGVRTIWQKPSWDQGPSEVLYVFVVDSRTMSYGWIPARYLKVLHGTK